MQFLWTIIWATLISTVVSYVLTSMSGDPFSLIDTLVLAAIFCIAIFILGEGILKQDKKGNN